MLARRLLGALLVRTLDDGTLLTGRIVETEAYVGVRDAASHAFRGHRSLRNESMYAQPGTAYVYFTYGMHHCFNIVCAREGVPEAVLVRALEPLEGLSRMAELRGMEERERMGQREQIGHRGQMGQRGHVISDATARSRRGATDIAQKMPRWLRDLCAGPARLCQALAIDRALDGEDLVSSSALFIAEAPDGMWNASRRGGIVASPRVGIDSAGKRDNGRGRAWVEKPLRFSVKDHPCVSVPPRGRSGQSLV